MVTFIYGIDAVIAQSINRINLVLELNIDHGKPNHARTNNGSSTEIDSQPTIANQNAMIDAPDANPPDSIRPELDKKHVHDDTYIEPTP